MHLDVLRNTAGTVYRSISPTQSASRDRFYKQEVQYSAEILPYSIFVKALETSTLDETQVSAFLETPRKMI